MSADQSTIAQIVTIITETAAPLRDLTGKLAEINFDAHAARLPYKQSEEMIEQLQHFQAALAAFNLQIGRLRSALRRRTLN